MCDPGFKPFLVFCILISITTITMASTAMTTTVSKATIQPTNRLVLSVSRVLEGSAVLLLVVEGVVGS